MAEVTDLYGSIYQNLIDAGCDKQMTDQFRPGGIQLCIKEILEDLKQGKSVAGNSASHRMMHKLAQDALRITAQLNGSYHEPEEMRKLFSELTGETVDDSFGMFPPFYTDCGKNIHVGKNVFINCCCHFQDQGGIYIGDNVLIGSHVVLATINHGQNPAERAGNFPKPIHIGNQVWIGAHATILPGVTIGDNAIVAAGAVATHNIPSNAVAGGVPAKVIKYIEEKNNDVSCNKSEN